MTVLSPAQIYTYARDAGLTPAAATIATAIALGESGGRTDAQGDVGIQDSKWGPSIGLWQIRSVKAQSGTGQPRDATRLTDPAFNAASMVTISGAGKNWSPWTVYTKGTYKRYLSQVATAVPAGGAYGSADAADRWTDNIPGGPDGGSAGGSSQAGFTESVADSMGVLMGPIFTIAVKVVGAVAAVSLVVVGALNTVSK